MIKVEYGKFYEDNGQRVDSHSAYVDLEMMSVSLTMIDSCFWKYPLAQSPWGFQ